MEKGVKITNVVVTEEPTELPPQKEKVEKKKSQKEKSPKEKSKKEKSQKEKTEKEKSEKGKSETDENKPIQPWLHPDADESFLNGPSKVIELFKMLEEMQSTAKNDDRQSKREIVVEKDHTDEHIDNFLVKERMEQVASNQRSKRTLHLEDATKANLDQMTFMRQIEPTKDDRILARIERERAAMAFRRHGNVEFRKLNFDQAFIFYSKGIDYIKDTPVLYVNRAACHLKKQNYSLAILDCDFVLTHLNDRHMHAWLYRGTAYKRMNEESNYEESIMYARRYNPKFANWIDHYLERMRTEF